MPQHSPCDACQFRRTHHGSGRPSRCHSRRPTGRFVARYASSTPIVSSRWRQEDQPDHARHCRDAAMSIGWYNGWSAGERRATLPRLREAIRSGQLPKPSRCSICGFTNGSDPTGRNWCTYHDERYDVLEPYPVCRTCHGKLHRRFDWPRPWLRLIEAHGDGTRWFEILSLDAGSKDRPFRDTYPDGLPIHGEGDRT